MGKYAFAMTYTDKMIMAERKRACRIVLENCLFCAGEGIRETIKSENGRMYTESGECEDCGPVIAEIMGGH